MVEHSPRSAFLLAVQGRHVRPSLWELLCYRSACNLATWQFGIAINTMSYSFTHTCRISPGAPGRTWRCNLPDQSSFHLDKSLAELSLILPCQVFPHHVHAVSVRHGCSCNILWHCAVQMCDLMAQNSHRVFILFNSCFLCTRAVCGLLYQEFIWPSSRRTKDGKKTA